MAKSEARFGVGVEQKLVGRGQATKLKLGVEVD